jgi:hypothetical protein
MWKVVKRTNGPPEDWEVVNVQNQSVFHIHDARQIKANLSPEWKILHYMGDYPPEEWLGNPHHYKNAGQPRARKPEDLKCLPSTRIP